MKNVIFLNRIVSLFVGFFCYFNVCVVDVIEKGKKRIKIEYNVCFISVIFLNCDCQFVTVQYVACEFFFFLVLL